MSKPSTDKLKPLYKKNSKGTFQVWQIHVEHLKDSSTIVTTYGEHNGKQQTTSDTISEGKNIGKVNETTPQEQSILEAYAKWTKKKKSGYVEKLDDAKSNKLDKVIEGGTLPMLATAIEKVKNFEYPCLTQPKLDGVRCIAIINELGVTLWSRTRKQITSCEHIERELEKVFSIFMRGKQTLTLDGEFYNHELKDDFDTIISGVRSSKPNEHSSKIQYHIYDVINDEDQDVRLGKIQSVLAKANKSKHIFLVESFLCGSYEIAEKFNKGFVNQGYEGSMLRSIKAKYQSGKRSKDLLKFKTFMDDEFTIIGIEEGKGKLKGHVGAFVCETIDGTQFKAKLDGDTKKLKEHFENQKSCIGKLLTVKFFGYTSKNNVPRFPVGLRIREGH